MAYVKPQLVTASLQGAVLPVSYSDGFHATLLCHPQAPQDVCYLRLRLPDIIVHAL